ncbi:hypothetical protein HPP92_022210 [Vanilla planifolia]|uniref:Uncharacterized protein n=1 Tax=Vanilla planifolia TaxID=51239 RepID=A0A835PTL1_VANPL|nr:hypothetical protein HPP92_022210 [Vanilla planifolia]
MDKQGRNLAPTAPRKKKKKQAKDEADRLKQAEKKKRRLEKAIATSAAIRSELEKKKLKEKEYLERLDVEGAAIAESVALHVLVGEDSDESCNITPSNNRRFSSFDSSHDRSIFMDHYNLAKHSVVLGRISTTYGYRNKWNGSINEMPMSPNLYCRHLHSPFLEGMRGGEEASASADQIAADVVSSLRIADTSQIQFPAQNTATNLMNRMVAGHDFDSLFNTHGNS